MDISVRPAARNDNFAFVWEGYINIPTPGNYTFETVSDDGSRLYFNSLYSASATALVNNDGLHAPVSATGIVYIPAAGVYPISITFFEKDGGENMQVFWTGPGFARQPIPNSAFVQSAEPQNISYKYYEGSWNSLPDFSTLTPVKTGISPNIDINARPAGRNDNFAFVWEGYINIPTPGNYTFETVSDDGSRLYFNTQYLPTAIPTVENDGVHAPGAATGTVYIAAAGAYPIAITFFEKEGGETMQVYWTGPGFARQLIPNSAFTKSAQPKNFTYRYYEGSFNFLPDFSMLTPVKTGASANVDLNVRPAGRNDNFAFLWEGYINIPTPGNYTFETLSDDGSRLYFNTLYSPSAGYTVNNDGVHAARSNRETINIPAAGSYPIAITFFEKEGDEIMQVYWSGPGFTRQLIPDAAFIQPAGTTANAYTQMNAGAVISNAVHDADKNNITVSKIYPDPRLA